MSHFEVSPSVSVEMLCGSSTRKAVLTENIVRALREIEKTGSVNKAARQLHMGYSNTLRSIAAVEKALGIVLVERAQGPSGSTLTDDGRRLIDLFNQTQSKTQQYANAVVRGSENEVSHV